MISIWEKQSFLKYDYIIIGAGIVGLSTAISLKEKNTRLSILILERGVLPTGASTKNAGFACFGSFTELLSDITSMGVDGCMQLVEERWTGLNLLRHRLGNKQIRYENLGGYELLFDQDNIVLDKLQEVNELLFPLLKSDVYSLKPDLVADFGFAKEQVKNVIFNPHEGQLDTGLMMKELIKLAQSLHIDILTGSEVTGFEPGDKEVKVLVADKALGSELQFKAAGLAICTNAFTKKILPDIPLVPGRGIVLTTNPIQGLKFKGAFHFHEGYYYFRNYGNRILFGGGRNLDLQGEATTEFQVNEKILESLHYYLREVIIPDQPYQLEHLWTGIMAFGDQKRPLLEKVRENVVVGVRLGGMGIAIGSLWGKKLADLLLPG